jgi:hypothetical protein
MPESSIDHVAMLHHFVTVNRKEIIARYHATLETRFSRAMNTSEIECGLPPFLAQLVHELRPGLSSRTEMTRLGATQAHDLLSQRFTISEVIRHYADIGDTITQLTIDAGAPIGMDDVRVLDRCVDDVIAGALAAHHGTHGVLPSAIPSQHIVPLSRDLRECINTARVALRVVKSGHLGLAGSTAAVIDSSLLDAHDLIARIHEILEVQLDARPQ